MATKTKTTKKTMPKVEKTLDSMDLYLEQMNKVKAELEANQNKPEASLTNIQKLHSKIDELETKADAWAFMDAQIGELKALRRSLTGDKGRTSSLPATLRIKEIAPYTVIFLSAMIKEMRLIRNKIVSR